jgi:hypothetical protein
MKRWGLLMQTGGETDSQDAEARLRRWVGDFATGYPEAWGKPQDVACEVAQRLLEALTKEIRCYIVLARVARLHGAELRGKYGYTTPEDTDEASADLRRGLAWIAIDLLHGTDCTDLMAGDMLSAEQAAFYVADDWWYGRDDRQIEDWADIRRVREQLMLDALDVLSDKRSDMIDFSARFIERHPELIREAAWGLRLVGSSEDFEEEVWAATGDDDLWRGVHFFAEIVLMSLPDKPCVH